MMNPHWKHGPLRRGLVISVRQFPNCGINGVLPLTGSVGVTNSPWGKAHSAWTTTSYYSPPSGLIDAAVGVSLVAGVMPASSTDWERHFFGIAGTSAMSIMFDNNVPAGSQNKITFAGWAANDIKTPTQWTAGEWLIVGARHRDNGASEEDVWVGEDYGPARQRVTGADQIQSDADGAIYLLNGADGTVGATSVRPVYVAFLFAWDRYLSDAELTQALREAPLYDTTKPLIYDVRGTRRWIER